MSTYRKVLSLCPSACRGGQSCAELCRVVQGCAGVCRGVQCILYSASRSQEPELQVMPQGRRTQFFMIKNAIS